MERMRYTYLRVGFIYALVSFLSNAYYIFSPGVIGFRHDWRIPYLPGQVWDRFFEAIFTWNSISGRGCREFQTLYYMKDSLSSH